jgi:hypothetical protein
VRSHGARRHAGPPAGPAARLRVDRVRIGLIVAE